MEATPEDHPDRAMWLGRLGDHFKLRHEHTGYPLDLSDALAAEFASWNMTTASTLTRIQAASSAAAMLVFSPLVKDFPRAGSLLRDAIHLLPLVASRSLQREDQQYILGKLTGLASLAASVSLEVRERPVEALRLLELGRSVTNGQLLDYRSDISDPMEHHPALAEEFDSLRLCLGTSRLVIFQGRLEPSQPPGSSRLGSCPGVFTSGTGLTLDNTLFRILRYVDESTPACPPGFDSPKEYARAKPR